jgi:hypothetical protein
MMGRKTATGIIEGVSILQPLVVMAFEREYHAFFSF